VQPGRQLLPIMSMSMARSTTAVLRKSSNLCQLWCNTPSTEHLIVSTCQLKSEMFLGQFGSTGQVMVCICPRPQISIKETITSLLQLTSFVTFVHLWYVLVLAIVGLDIVRERHEFWRARVAYVRTSGCVLLLAKILYCNTNSGTWCTPTPVLYIRGNTNSRHSGFAASAIHDRRRHDQPQKQPPARTVAAGAGACPGRRWSPPWDSTPPAPTSVLPPACLRRL
jgi:hypothetical protein